jgi:hypothetical protein
MKRVKGGKSLALKTTSAEKPFTTNTSAALNKLRMQSSPYSAVLAGAEPGFNKMFAPRRSSCLSDSENLRFLGVKLRFGE